MPFAAVGAEECYDILVDSDEMRHSPLGPILEWITPRPDEIPPVVAGIGPLPRPQRFYFRFSAAIDTRRWARRASSQAACLELRAEVARAIERAIALLRREQRRDLEATLMARLARSLPVRRTVSPRRKRRPSG